MQIGRAFCFLCFTSTLFGSTDLQDLLKQIFADDAYQLQNPPQVVWLKEGAAWATLEKSTNVKDGQDVVRYSSDSGARDVVVPAEQLIPAGAKKELKIDGYQFSADQQQVLIFTNSQPVWRQHTRGDYWLFELSAHALKKLGGEGEASAIKFAKLSPDGQSIAFVRKNNIYVQDLKSMKVRELTHDGSDTVVNGTSDWVYEEELDVRDGFRWSPDGRRIAFWHFDCSGVGEYPLINYTDSLYPKIRMIPYPKAGTTNSAVTVGVVDVRSGKSKRMNVPGDSRNNYIARMEWAGNSKEVVIEQLNRLQNTADLYLADASSGSVQKIFEDHDKAWVDVNDIRSMGDGFVWLSERDGWRHAYLVKLDHSDPVLLTQGSFDVIGIAGVSATEKAIYFTASPGNATQSYLYRAAASGPRNEPVRVTPAGQPGFHDYQISPNAEWAVHRYSRFDDPPRFEFVHVPDGKIVRKLVDNNVVRDKLTPLLANPSEFFQVDIGAGVTLDGWMIRPKDFDACRKYPVLVYVYGEPAGQTVLDTWAGPWFRALAQAGYIVVSFDNRGTPAPKGREWRKVIYGSVGPLATEEQTKAIQKLCALRPYLNENRIGVWGWSGGATDTLNLMFRSPDVYKVGMAIAPVPDQKLYDTIYQERYMGLPHDNPEGYRRGSAINFASGLKGKLLLVHGTGDDNVHFQGTQMLINRLVQLNKQFAFMEYPNRTHAISEGEGTTLHLFTLLADFLETNLSPDTHAAQAH